MPFVEEKHLVNIHRHLEEKEMSEERLSRELRKQRLLNYKYRKANSRLLWFLASCLVLITAGFLVYLTNPSFFLDEQDLDKENKIVLNKGHWLELQENLEGRSKEVDKLRDILNTMDYRAINNELIYTVQVAALVDEKVSLVSEDLLNMAVYKDLPYNKYALGSFTNLKDAVELRNVLLELGFKDAFIASYKNGKRQKIEESYVNE